jgi:5,10-methylenetetrahydromethanopterin reductase
MADNNNHSLQFGTIGFATPGLAVPAAVAAERDGFDIFLLTDSQCLRGDVYTQLVLCGKETDTILLGTGVTNPITRHPSVTAASITGVHAECGGRAILGIGRGDSAVLHVGCKPAKLSVYAEYVQQVQSYLLGEQVDQNGFPSRLRWLDQLEIGKVPLDMVGSGPKSLALAATIADRVTLAVGADPERIVWGIEQIHRGAKAVGRNPAEIRIGAYINIAVGKDNATARDSIKGSVATFAHFSAAPGADFDNQPAVMQKVTGQLLTEYDTMHHTEGAALHTRHLTDSFIDWFSVIGTADNVTGKLQPLIKLGLSHIYFVGSGRDQLVKEVIPALREYAKNQQN